MMKASEFVSKLIEVATKHNTLYVMGCFGAPINEKNAEKYINNHSYNRKNGRDKQIMDAINTDCFGFDCICLIKGILWGWNGDKNHPYGGAEYKSNGVDDITLTKMLRACTDISENFSEIQNGEYLFTEGHCGIYIGNGLAVEATPAFDNRVQITAVGNIGKVSGYNTRTWQKHGKLPYIEYETKSENQDYIKIKKEELITLRERLNEILS